MECSHHCTKFYWAVLINTTCTKDVQRTQNWPSVPPRPGLLVAVQLWPVQILWDEVGSETEVGSASGHNYCLCSWRWAAPHSPLSLFLWYFPRAFRKPYPSSPLMKNSLSSRPMNNLDNAGNHASFRASWLFAQEVLYAKTSLINQSQPYTY
jgi:hypothetical protein